MTMENKAGIEIDRVLDGMETLRTGVEFVGLACAELDGRVPVGAYMPAVMRLIGEKVDALAGRLRDTKQA